MRMLRQYLVLLLVLPVMAVVGCDEGSNADKAQRDATDNLMAEAQRQLGMPDITSFTERRFMKQILELRDKETVTHTYIIDFSGNLHYLCQSIGYGLPYSTQYTNPERRVYSSSSSVTLPQPDPNGLFMPDGMAATWVLCFDESEGDIDPLYIEPEILVSPFKLRAEGGDYYDAESQAAQATEGIN